MPPSDPRREELTAMFSRQRISPSHAIIPLTIAALVVIAICIALYLREAGQITEPALTRENTRMEIYAGLVTNDLSDAITDLRLLASGDGLRSYLTSGKPEDLARAVRRAEFFSKDNPAYDKIRYIDENGKEIFRLNRGDVVVPPDQLQDKSDRPFFQKTKDLDADQIYISPIDLNFDNGKMEMPIKPTVRVAMPVVDSTGRHRGIYVINYRAADLLDRLRQFVPRYAQRLRVLNSEGYWLAAFNPDQEWGFMLPGRQDITLAKTDPALWAQITASPAGQVPYHGGYFTWKRILLNNVAPGKPVRLVPDNPYIVVASEMTADEWNALLASLRQTFVIVALILIVAAMAITWFVQKQRLAQQERDRFFNLTRDMLCVASLDGHFIRVNPAWEAALGYTPEEMTGRPFLDFVHPEDREKTIATTSNLAHGDEVLSFENRYRCKDGSYRWLLWNARPLVELGLTYGSARDLTERKQIEEQMRQGEMRSRSIIESAHDAFISTDVDGRIKEWNLKAEATFGWTRDEVVGRFLHDTIIPSAYREAHQRGIVHLKATGEGPVLNQMLELTALRKSGEEFPVEFVIWPLRMGSETTFHAFVRDITVRKQAEESIQKLNHELKQRATQLEAANKELEAFSYSVSHDLRAPLRHIHGFVEMLQNSPSFEGDATAKRHMSVISRAAHEMGRLIDDLLAFSRTGRAQMRPVEIDQRTLIDQVIADGIVDRKDRKITWEIHALEKVSGDPSLLRLVWVNLIDNALKYSRNTAETKIEIGQMPPDADAIAACQAIFFIRDNGVGFDMQYATKLFGVFQRLHRPEDFEGTGIGLANVQRIILRHGGRIWAESQPGKGAAFYFTLPLANTAAKGKPHG